MDAGRVEGWLDQRPRRSSVDRDVEAGDLNRGEGVVGRVLDGIKSFGDYKILVMSDHPTPIDIRTHINEPVPFAIYSSADESVKNDDFVYTENSASTSDEYVSEGYKLVSMLIEE